MLWSRTETSCLIISDYIGLYRIISDHTASFFMLHWVWTMFVFKVETDEAFTLILEGSDYYSVNVLMRAGGLSCIFCVWRSDLLSVAPLYIFSLLLAVKMQTKHPHGLKLLPFLLSVSAAVVCFSFLSSHFIVQIFLLLLLNKTKWLEVILSSNRF